MDSLSRDDVLAYLDVVVNDLTVRNLKRSGNCIICFVTDEAEDGAVALSKMVCTFGKKSSLKLLLPLLNRRIQNAFSSEICKRNVKGLWRIILCDRPLPFPIRLCIRSVYRFNPSLKSIWRNLPLNHLTMALFMPIDFYIMAVNILPER